MFNIDASVNNETYQAMHDKTLFNDYFKKRNIRFLVDQEYVVKMYWDLYGPAADMNAFLRPIARIKTPYCFADGNVAADIVIYEVNPLVPASRQRERRAW